MDKPNEACNPVHSTHLLMFRRTNNYLMVNGSQAESLKESELSSYIQARV